MKKLMKALSLLCLIATLASACGAPGADSPRASITPAVETNAVPRVVLAELFTGDW